jgi:hypothetical protein
MPDLRLRAIGAGGVRVRVGPTKRLLCGTDTATEARRRGRDSGTRVGVAPLLRAFDSPQPGEGRSPIGRRGFSTRRRAWD